MNQTKKNVPTVKDASKGVLLVLGNQLFPIELLPDKDSFSVFMAEDPGLCTHFKYHKHKIILFLAAMRSYADALVAAGYQVHYERLAEPQDNSSVAGNSTFESKLAAYMANNSATDLIHFEIEDKFFEGRINDLVTRINLKQTVLQSPMFLTSRQGFQDYLGSVKKPFMKSFYERQRKQLGILLDTDGKPVGGKWSYDTENRERFDHSMPVPGLPEIKPNKHVRDVSKLVSKLFPDHPGDASGFWLPVTLDEANDWLDDFLVNRFHDFGRYEDALTPRHFALFHSVLSPLMNLGLLTPGYVVDRTLRHAHKHDIPMNSLEGFIRQIIGWREFVRGIYQNFSDQQDHGNHFGHQRKLSHHWYTCDSGLPPLDDALGKAKSHGWNHHIERLMVISCLMLLCDVHPQEVHRWFMEMYVDSSDWVMGPNVYGMGQFSDGGLFATKPYVCGSNYILKMSDWKKAPWCATWDGLYWRFVAEKSKFLKNNQRLSMMVATWNKKTASQKKAHYDAAEAFIDKMTHI